MYYLGPLLILLLELIEPLTSIMWKFSEIVGDLSNVISLTTGLY